MTNFDEYFTKLGNLARTNGSNTSCRKLIGILTGLGFEIEDCGSAGHKIARHPAVLLEESINFNCGHNKGNSIKPFYIKQLHKFVKQYEDTIKEYLQ